MQVYVIQKKTNVLNFKYNAEVILQALREARADVVITSELFLTGYPVEDRILQSDFKQDLEENIARIVEATLKYPKLILIFGTPIFEKNKIFNGALIVQNGIILKKAKKCCLPNYGVFDEKRYFSKSSSLTFVNILGKKVLVAICEDIWSENYFKKACKEKPDYIFALNASPFEKDKFAKRIEIAKRFKTNLVYVNQILGYDELVFDGGSFALNKKGDVVGMFPFFEEKAGILENANYTAPSYLDLIYKALTFGLSEYLTQNKVNGVIVGISGGIDSALVAKIAKDAIGEKNVLCVMLPSVISSQESKKDATDFLSQNNLSYIEIPIQNTFAEVKKLTKIEKDISKQNLQSRIRGLILMALSNEHGKMLLTTGNKSELSIGYCTIYGDMNGGFNPIKDLFKTEVYELCKHLKCFPSNMLAKPATAELSQNQTDEVSIGITYKMLDFILAKIIEQKLSVAQISQEIQARDFEFLIEFRRQNKLEDISKIQLVQNVFTLLSQSEFKRKQAVVGTKISSRSFGRDWRFGLLGIKF